MKPTVTRAARPKVCHVVAGPNGSGKSTFALRFLPDYAGSIEYVNPDLVAQGLSPTDIRLSAIKAGKLTLARIAELIAAGESFGFETTLSGRGHLKLLADAKARGYEIHLYYLWMPVAAMLPVPSRRIGPPCIRCNLRTVPTASPRMVFRCRRLTPPDIQPAGDRRLLSLYSNIYNNRSRKGRLRAAFCSNPLSF